MCFLFVARRGPRNISVFLLSHCSPSKGLPGLSLGSVAEESGTRYSGYRESSERGGEQEKELLQVLIGLKRGLKSVWNSGALPAKCLPTRSVYFSDVF